MAKVIIREMQIKTTMKYNSHWSEWRSLGSLQITNAREDVGNRELPTLLKGMEIGAATMENSMEVPQKIKNRVAIRPSNTTPGHISRETFNSKRCMYSNVHSRIIYNSQEMEENYMSIDI